MYYGGKSAMQSTSTSKNVLELNSFTLKFDSRVKSNFRNLFVEMISSPFNYFAKPKDTSVILDQINIQVKHNDIIALIGKNGVGKTSLCRCISGLYGKSHELKLHGSCRALYDSSISIHPELSGYENAQIMIDLYYPHLSSQERKEILEESIAFSDIGEKIYLPHKHFSAGMKARLFLSIVSSQPTDLLIMDEIFENADMFFNEKIYPRLEKLIQSSAATLVVSHDEEIFKKICNRAIVLDNQKVVFDGSVEDGLNFYGNINGH
jgi:ABC-type polysaccharide/polyol phosphate transport system ATPase subunit